MPSPMSTAWFALPLLFVTPRADEVTFGVAAGTKVTKTFEVNLDAELEELEVSVGGQKMPVGAELEMTVESKTKLVFTDVYREMGDGRPKVLARTFDELSSSESQEMSAPGAEPRNEEREEESVLEGKTVVFTWNDEAAAFEPKYEGEAAAGEELLADLDEDVDLRAFLPGKEVAIDDTWEIDGKEFASVFDPSGDVALRSDEDDESDEEMQDELNENFSGDAQGTFKGFREEDGVRVAVIALKADLETRGDREKDGGEESFEVSLELEGELLWHVAAKRAHSLALSGPTKLTVAQTGTGESEDGKQIEFVQKFLLGGTMSIQATWAAAQ